ncbi:MAG TPA: hypothetical protein EYP10_04870, partial [Armatimonadetes bacterium]|nr:hypothetical protein [Armatimonadota bacterium]
FVASDTIGLPPEGVAASLAVVALAVSGADPGDILKRIDWETVFFVAGFLFVVKGLERSGALARFSELITMAGAGEPTLTAVVVLVLSGVLSAFFANVAVALSMAPAVEILGVPDTRPVWAALVLGTNLGGATIPYASIVMVMVMNALKQEGLRADLGEALRAGAVTSAAQLLASAAYILVRFGVAG